VTIREENGIAALEVMSRFAADPKWLIHLPPTMSPPEATEVPGFLEHPREAFAYFKHEGVPSVMCEAKHMGSRAIAVVCRTAEVARKRFGVTHGDGGIIYTRTGRRFFESEEMERALLEILRGALDGAHLWDRVGTEWVCLDCELMPWSAKAQGLIKNQYAAVGAAARSAMPDAVAALERAVTAGAPAAELRARFTERARLARLYEDAYRRYCWPAERVTDLRLAPFHVLASEGAVHVDEDHVWHMERAAELASAGSPVIIATEHRVVDVTNEESVAAGIAWWEELTAKGGEGMVVKPLNFVARGKRGLLQPAVKCRGLEYLRIIYGPEYSMPENLDRLRKRGLSAKRSLALREFALGIESLERFVRHEPLRRVHEAVFGVLALESEPVDPRL
jgi:protein phosphatase